MKNLKQIFCAFMAAAFMVGCSDQIVPDPNDPNNPTLGPDNGEGFYMGVDIQMPTGAGSRSATDGNGGSTAGTEVGQDFENTVTTALIVLAAAQNYGENTDGTPIIPEWGFIAASEVQNDRIQDLNVTGNKQYRATAKLQKTQLDQFYQQTNQNNPAPEYPVYVFVFCNPTKALVNMFTDEGSQMFGKTSWRDEICEVRQGVGANNYNIGIWGANSFLMNNVNIAKRYLPGKIDTWNNFNTPEKAFHLSDKNEGSVDNSAENDNTRGSIRVERSVARFDFRDGSGNDNTYQVLYAYNNDGTQKTDAPLVNVKLQKMCLVNMSNAFYFIPRVSSNGQNENVTYCGVEIPWSTNQAGATVVGNYVVGPYAKRFAKPLMDEDNPSENMKYDEYFNFAFFENDGTFNNNFSTAKRWDVVSIDDVLSGTTDKYQGSDTTVINPETNKPYEYDGSFKIWRYVTENVIPSPNENQKNGISTGVVFRGKLTGAYKAGADYNEEAWNKGYSQNLDNCLNGKKFTYNGDPDHTLQGNAQDDPILYYINGSLYMGWRHLRQAAIQASITKNVSGELEINRSSTLYKAVFGDGPIPSEFPVFADGKTEYKKAVWMDTNSDGTLTPIVIVDPRWEAEGGENGELYKQSPEYFWTVWAGEDRPTGGDGEEGKETPKELVNFRNAVTAQGVTIYQSAKEDGVAGYYCYYYYWNRHNDNRIPGVMGGMEFDVVRNNVYKLWVEKISRLGHPRIPGNDPEPPHPDTPDESDLIYLDVRVTIVPWTVRLNSIQF